MPDQLLVDIATSGRTVLGASSDGDPPRVVEGPAIDLSAPTTVEEREELRWYLQEYLRTPYGVYEKRGERIGNELLPEVGRRMFAALFPHGPALDAYVALRRATRSDRRPEIVIRSADASWLALPWELMVDPLRQRPVVLDGVAVSRALLEAPFGSEVTAPGRRLRVLLVIARPAGTQDPGYRMIARTLLECVEAARGLAELTVLRPPTLTALSDTLATARTAGEPFQVVHFDGHGALVGGADGGVLIFESENGSPLRVPAQDVATVISEHRVPLVVLNACESGALGPTLDSAVATRLLEAGVESVIAMAYKVYAVAAAEFMAAFYDRIIAGDRVGDAVVAGRARLASRNLRPSPRGGTPLSDWVVPVHYMRGDVRFPFLAGDRLATARDTRETGDAFAPDSTFVGRDGSFLALEVAARRGGVVVHGPGGTGKTELVRAFGRWWRDTSAVERPELVVWRSFEPGAAGAGLDGIVASIGHSALGATFVGLDAATRREAVRDLTAHHRLLLVLDNLETLFTMPDPTDAVSPLGDDERAELLTFLADISGAGRTAVLITSRTPEKWLGDVTRVEVGGLDTQEASEYADVVLSSIPEAAAQRSQRSFGELMEHLAGHPLCLRLILPLLASTDPATILSGLHGRALLPGVTDDGDDSTDRTTSLSACVSYLITHLHPGTRRPLAVVSLFLGVVDAHVLSVFTNVAKGLERFAGIDAASWEQTFDAAAEVGLLTSLGAGNYAVHPALPARLAAVWRAEEPATYDASRAAALDALLLTFASYVPSTVEHITSGEADMALAFVDRHRRTIAHLTERALDTGQWMLAGRLVKMSSAHWHARGLGQEMRAWTDRARARLARPDGSAPDFGTPEGELWLDLVSAGSGPGLRAAGPPSSDDDLSDVVRVLGLDDATRRECQDQQERFVRTPLEGRGDSRQIARKFFRLGTMAHRRGAVDEAMYMYEMAVQLEKRAGNRPAELAEYYRHLGMVCDMLGHSERAKEWFQQELAIDQELGNRAATALCSHHLGLVAMQIGEVDDAVAWFLRAVEIRDELGDRPGLAISCHHVGLMAVEKKAYPQAALWFLESLSLHEKLGDRDAMALNYPWLGELALRQNSWEVARQWYLKSLTITDRADAQQETAYTCFGLGRAAEGEGALDEAAQWFRRSLTIREAIGDRQGAVLGRTQLGVIARKRNALDEAREWHERAVTSAEQLRKPHRASASCRELGVLEEAEGRPRDALRWFVRAVAPLPEFPRHAEEPGLAPLVRLACVLGVDALQACWREVTGRELPQTALTAAHLEIWLQGGSIP